MFWGGEKPVRGKIQAARRAVFARNPKEPERTVASPYPSSPSSSNVWQIQLFGGLSLTRGDETIARFRSQKFGLLLAYLSLFPKRSHSREELADLLWPDADSETGRVNLRTALASLRRQLEPPGTPAGSVLQTENRSHVRLNPQTVSSDVSEFEAALVLAARTAKENAGETIARLTRAVQFYNGPLLPGSYDDWALSERDRLAEAHLRALRQLVLLTRDGDSDQALDFARRAVSADPLREESHGAVIQLLMESGQVSLAQRQFDELTRLMRNAFDTAPAPEIAALLKTAPVKRPVPKALASPAPESVTAPNSAPSPAVTSAAAKVEIVATPPAEAVPQNLPLLPTRFFGRDEEIDALCRMLRDDARLVTITGPGGSGKTRVSVEVAQRLGRDFPSGIWFVPLADVREPERIGEAVAGALKIKRSVSDDTPLLSRICDALLSASASDTPALLVFDNFEQVADEGASVVVELLARVPHLTCLITSRQRLRIEAEQEFPLLPLPVPEHPGTPERLLEFSSVQLFVARARAARPDFQLTARNAASVAALCAKLEGIPLAIELAAAWAEALTPAQMLARMEKRLDLLISRRRDVSARHRTLRAAIEGSVFLLPPDAQTVFAALSVFRGGWTMDAAESVCDDPLAFAHLATLCDHSLVLRDSGDNSAIRFRMLETLREFAREQLESADETAARSVETRHAEYFTRLTREAVAQLTEPNQADALRLLESDHDNLRAVLDFRLRDGKLGAALALAAQLANFWATRGHFAEGRQRLSTLLEQAENDPSVPDTVRAAALRGLGKLAISQADYAVARPSHERALALSRQENDRVGIASSLSELGKCALQQSSYDEANQFFEEALAEYRAIGDTKGVALLLNNLGATALAKGLPNIARDYLEESLPLSRRVGHHRVVGITLFNLASIALSEGDFVRARTYYEESLAVRRDLGDVAGAGRVLEGLGHLAMEEGDSDAALHRLEESLVLQRKVGDKDAVASLCLHKAIVFTEMKRDWESAWPCLVESIAQCRQSGNRHYFANALDAVAVIAALRRDWERAVQLWAAAANLRNVLGVTVEYGHGRKMARAMDDVRAHLSPDAFEAAWKAGEKLTLPDAANLALGTCPSPAQSMDTASPSTYAF